GFAYVASQVAAHRLSGDLALFLGLVVGLQQAMFAITIASGGMYGAVLFMRRLFGFLDETRPHIAVVPAGLGVPAPLRFRRGLELHRVTFTYPEQAEPVLRDVSCMIGAGETVAVVGENGAGK